jgi:hypothetical protein
LFQREEENSKSESYVSKNAPTEVEKNDKQFCDYVQVRINVTQKFGFSTRMTPFPPGNWHFLCGISPKTEKITQSDKKIRETDKISTENPGKKPDNRP